MGTLSTLSTPASPGSIELRENGLSSTERQLRWVRRLALLLIVLAAFSVRTQDLAHPTGYMDETIYVVYGRMFLAQAFEEPLNGPLRWSFGWYLWPVMAALADQLGGIAAVRALGAALGALTVIALYGIGRRLFSPAVGIASAVCFALLAPAVYVFRIATRDCASLFFFAVGLWLFIRAWQERERWTWLASATAFFAAFLCKYVVAFFFPFLCLVSLAAVLGPEGRPRRSVLFFAFPLTALCALYVALYVEDLQFLLSYSAGYESLRAESSAIWRVYFAERWDFWVLALLSGFAWGWQNTSRRVVLALWLGAGLALFFQWASGADANWWKHVNYALLFLIPPAMAGFIRLVGRVTGQEFFIVSSLGTILLSVLLGWGGGTWLPERYFFWPSVDPLLAALEGRLAPQHRVLVDDSVFRYYLRYAVRPALEHQSLIADPFRIDYPYEGAWPNLRTGGPGYARAVRDGYFDFIVLNGGVGEEARLMNRAIRPWLSGRYALRFSMPEPNGRTTYELYERVNPAVRAANSLPFRVDIESPQSGAMVRTTGIRAVVSGRVTPAIATGFSAGGAMPSPSDGAQSLPAGAAVEVDIYTNRWYAQLAPNGSRRFPLHADGTFEVPVFLGGLARMQCQHLLRVRAVDSAGALLGSAISFGVARAEADGSAPPCSIAPPGPTAPSP